MRLSKIDDTDDDNDDDDDDDHHHYLDLVEAGTSADLRDYYDADDADDTISIDIADDNDGNDDHDHDDREILLMPDVEWPDLDLREWQDDMDDSYFGRHDFQDSSGGGDSGNGDDVSVVHVDHSSVGGRSGMENDQAVERCSHVLFGNVDDCQNEDVAVLQGAMSDMVICDDWHAVIGFVDDEPELENDVPMEVGKQVLARVKAEFAVGEFEEHKKKMDRMLGKGKNNEKMPVLSKQEKDRMGNRKYDDKGIEYVKEMGALFDFSDPDVSS